MISMLRYSVQARLTTEILIILDITKCFIIHCFSGKNNKKQFQYFCLFLLVVQLMKNPGG